MYGHASNTLQSRARRLAVAAPTHGGIEASDAFRSEVGETPEAVERRSLTKRLVRVQRALAAVKAKRAVVDIQRQLSGGSENRRQTKTHAALRLELIEEVQSIQARLSILNPIIRSQRIAAADKQHTDFGRAFMDVAKRMLAEPVYDRILTATLHYVGQSGEDA